MKIISTTNTRARISEIVNRVKYKGDVFAIGRRNVIDALIIQFPSQFNKDLNDITNVNTFSRSFDFLKNETELYGESDLKKRYA